MKKAIETLPPLKLIGITARTNNAREMDPAAACIGAMMGRYFGGGLAHQIPGRITPDTTYCVYTHYESDVMGDYTYFIGEAVDAFDAVPEGLEMLEIPAQRYAHFTTEPGAMPGVVIGAWQSIWSMSDEVLGGARAYVADMEIYGAGATDPQNSIVDVYIGIAA